MDASLYHVHMNVSNPSTAFPFYKKLFSFFNYKIIVEKKTFIGFTNESTDFWFIKTKKKFSKNQFHRKNTGLNHLAFRVSSKKEVDEFSNNFLDKNKIQKLYSSPKEFPEYTKGYYAVFFEGPDRLKLEVTFKPKL